MQSKNGNRHDERIQRQTEDTTGLLPGLRFWSLSQKGTLRANLTSLSPAPPPRTVIAPGLVFRFCGASPPPALLTVMLKEVKIAFIAVTQNSTFKLKYRTIAIDKSRECGR